MPLIFRRAALLNKIETTENVDASPSASTDAILVENVRVNPNPKVVETDEVSASLDPYDPIVGGMPVGVSFDIWLKGSGAAATPPEWGSLMKVCGWAETITASAIPASPEACNAVGGSTTKAVLGASAAGVAQTYRGMPLALSGAQAIDVTFIRDYTAGKGATITDTMAGSIGSDTLYQILANVLYSPASASISSATEWFYWDGVIWKFTGVRGDVSFSMDAGGALKASFNMMAVFESKGDTALATPAYQSNVKPIWKNGAFRISSASWPISQLQVGPGGQLVQPDNPNALEGFDAAVITRRQPRGTLSLYETLTANRNILADLRAGTKRSAHARLGASAGNRLALTMPSIMYLNETPENRQGLVGTNVPIACTGQDSGIYLCSF